MPMLKAGLRGVALLAIIMYSRAVAGPDPSSPDAPTQPAPIERLSLAPKYEPGQRYYLEWDWTHHRSLTLTHEDQSERNYKTQIEITVGVIEEVKSVSADKVITLDYTFDKIRVRLTDKVEEKEHTFTFDSTKDKLEEMKNGFIISRALPLGFTITIDLTPDGEWNKPHGTEPIFKKAEKFLENPSRARFATGLSGENLRTALKQVHMSRTTEPAAVGESWQRSVQVGLNMYKVICRFARIEGNPKNGKAIVSYHAEHDPEAQSKSMQSMFGESYEMKESVFDGEYGFDLALQRFVTGSEVGRSHIEAVKPPSDPTLKLVIAKSYFTQSYRAQPVQTAKKE